MPLKHRQIPTFHYLSQISRGCLREQGLSDL
jgi:hypothetical protein